MLGVLLALLLLSCSATTIKAACTGSGTTFTCTAGDTDQGHVQTAINTSSDGATITLQNGSYTFSGGFQFSGSKATTVRCESVGGCTISGYSALGENGTCSGDSTKLQRVSGFVFTGGTPVFWWAAGDNTTPCTRTVRIDHNTFTPTNNGGGSFIYFGHNTSTDNYIYGVIDHNSFTCSVGLANSCFYTHGLNGQNTPPIGSLGGPNNMFIEDNTYTSTTMDGSGSPVCLDSWGGVAFVFRYNTATNCRTSQHGVTHEWGPRNIEVYNNSFSFNAGAAGFGGAYRVIHHQGSGTFMVFNNTITAAPATAHDAGPIALLHYRSWTDGTAPRCNGTQPVDGNRTPIEDYYGYPCHRQPGRDPLDNFFPIYVWNNKWSDDNSKIDLACQSPGPPDETPPPATCVNHLIDNRDYFNAVSALAQTSLTSPFDGTTGMGFGTLANRPTTCSVALTDTGDVGKGGVGYFATDTGAGHVRARWPASADAVGVAGYKIYRDGVLIGTSPTNSYIDDTASPDTQYSYTMSAYDAAGNESAQSPPGAVRTTLFAGLGILYRCASPNQWVTHYAPYPYPHPLTLTP